METPHQMKQRHKAELKALAESAGKKKKGSAKELKQKEDELKKKHEEELSSLQAGASASSTTSEAVNELAKDTQNLVVQDDEGDEDEAGVTEAKTGTSKSRSARKKEAKAAKEKERQAQVAAEVAAMKNPRKEEKEKLEAQLKNLGMSVAEIRADGHCLYSSISDQLVATKHPAASQLVKRTDAAWEPAPAIRQLAASYMLANQKDFIGFVTDDDGEPLKPTQYEQYCRNITQPDLVIWGGEPEIVALSKALGSPITVHAAGVPPMVIGSDQRGIPLHISLHRFELSAGNHYNSVVKVKG